MSDSFPSLSGSQPVSPVIAFQITIDLVLTMALSSLHLFHHWIGTVGYLHFPFFLLSRQQMSGAI